MFSRSFLANPNRKIARSDRIPISIRKPPLLPCRPCNSLLDQAAPKISIYQPTLCSFDRGHETFIANGFPLRKAGESFGFENAHHA
jgi:hypothetical protein